jgi:hypothetical protein
MPAPANHAKPKKRPRPQRPAGERTRRRDIRWTDAELDETELRARELGLSWTEYVRRAALGRLP